MSVRPPEIRVLSYSPAHLPVCPALSIHPPLDPTARLSVLLVRLLSSRLYSCLSFHRPLSLASRLFDCFTSGFCFALLDPVFVYWLPACPAAHLYILLRADWCLVRPCSIALNVYFFCFLLLTPTSLQNKVNRAQFFLVFGKLFETKLNLLYVDQFKPWVEKLQKYTENDIPIIFSLE